MIQNWIDLIFLHKSTFRYIGGKREVAIFENFRQVGPIIKVIPVGFGQGAVIAVLSDPNYEVLHKCF